METSPWSSSAFEHLVEPKTLREKLYRAVFHFCELVHVKT